MISLESTSCYTQIKMHHVKRFDYNSNFNALHLYNKKKGCRSDDEVCAIRMRFPTKVPVIVDRYVREYELPYLTKRKFLVPQEITMAQFAYVLRDRLKVGPTRAIFLLVNNRSMISPTRTIADVYCMYRQNDGFLYMTYSSQEVFG